MKRDNDLLRALLLEIEASEDWHFPDPGAIGDDDEFGRRSYHCELLGDAGYLCSVGVTWRLTNSGHDFLEAMRDEGIWKKTKDAVAQTGGNATLGIIKQIATAFLKKQINERTGLDL